MTNELAKKLLAITKEMGNLEKKGRNDFHNYDYVTEADAMEKFQELCIKHKVLVAPSFVPEEMVGSLTILKCSFIIYDAENVKDSLVVQVVGQGIDKGDKGAYKAMTGAYKYFILKTFQVVCGDPANAHDPENSKFEAPVASGPVSDECPF